MLATLAAIALATSKTTQPWDPIEKPPFEISHGGFFTRVAYFQGLPILATDPVDERAMRVVVATFDKMLAKALPGTVASLVKEGCTFSIIDEHQGVTDLPQYAYLKNDPKTDWDKRSRGFGGRHGSGAEENILELPSDRYRGASIFIHEFAHMLDEFGFAKIDPTFVPEITASYKQAMEKGLWKNTYAATDRLEYFAEGVQMYFDCNQIANPPNGIHIDIGNREGLKLYDPTLFAVIDRVFGSNPWRYEGKYSKTGASLPAWLLQGGRPPEPRPRPTTPPTTSGTGSGSDGRTSASSRRT